MVDRDDQVKWYLDPKTATSFCAQLENNHHEIRQWLLDVTQDTVVISGRGSLPRRGTTDHPTLSIYDHVYRDQYRFYFKSDQDAMLFKLAWGGTL